MLESICLADGVACQFSPAVVQVEFPLEIGKTWSFRSTVTSETFYCGFVAEVEVDEVEEITTPAGQFDTFRVFGKDRIYCRDTPPVGPTTPGWSSYWVWYASIKGKLVVVKEEYRNTFGSWMRRELLSAELK